MTDFFITFGYWGMGLAAFIAGSFLPFSSEAVMLALLCATDMDPVTIVASATLGNVLGSMFNYYLGRLGSKDIVARWCRIKPERMDKAQAYVMKYGAWMGLLTFIPILGSALAISLGLLRANAPLTWLSVFVGKSLRYIVLASPWLL